MFTPAHNAITNLRNRLRNLRKEEEGAISLTELLVYIPLAALSGLFVLQILIPAHEIVEKTVHDENATKPTVILAEKLRLQAIDIAASTPQDSSVGAVLNTSDFDATLRATNDIPTTFHYYICKSQNSHLFIAAYDTERPEDGFTAAQPYNNDGSKIKGLSCGQWEKINKREASGKITQIYGNFIWEPINYFISDSNPFGAQDAA